MKGAPKARHAEGLWKAVEHLGAAGDLRQGLQDLAQRRGRRHLKDFDPVFYTRNYPDLVGLNLRQLQRHYLGHGLDEGRYGSLTSALMSLEAAYGPGSPRFGVEAYRAHNPDLAAGDQTDLALVIHYFERGRDELRPVSPFYPKFYRDLYYPGSGLDALALEQDWTAAGEARFGSAAQMLRAFGFDEDGGWIERIEVAAFRALNPWAGDVRTREQAALAIVRDGWRRLAMLGPGAVFDPADWRARHPGRPGSDAELYRDWLGQPAKVGPAPPEPTVQRSHPSKPRLLLVNVLFPPQSVGGATRVVRDNVDSWIRSGFADEAEIAVFTTDHQARPADRMRLDSYRGLPVFRVSPRIEPDMDWRPLDPQMAVRFKAVLELWRPDLVHFHATQQLTASCLEACRDSNVPYVVTVHDAWWLSDWQFLTDEDGFVHDPAEPLVQTTAAGVTPAQSAERKRVLADHLNHARAVLAVSASFAELYRRAGICAATVLANGLPQIPPAPRRPSADGRVRLGHLGGTSVHKGYALVYAALLQGGFERLDLTVVDHHRPAGYLRSEVWGSTPVRLIGRIAQARMSELYAELDVVLAPSVWPESYGLVAREALACGLWVVASDRGAIGDDVQAGVNGFVIDVSDPAALVRVLGEIDADPQRFASSPPAPRPMRRTEDQAADLAVLYRRLWSEGAGAPLTLGVTET